MIRSLQQSLQRWYARNARDLPWRRRVTPYRVWVSEIMLQQTRVEAVREKYVAFMRRFPTLRALAQAPLEHVLEAWSGLGYYRRAHMLHAAAREIAARHRGRFPRSHAQLLALPGVGRYTAGAIMSIAFDQPCPIVDGNIVRVYARLHRTAKPANKDVWAFAQQWADRAASSAIMNQAIMELGAIVCTPVTPRCDICPVRKHCKAGRHGDAREFPAPAPRREKRSVRYLLLVLRDAKGRVLLRKRPQGDKSSLLPGGLWELPHAEWPQGAPTPEIPADNLRLTGKAVQVTHSIMDCNVTLHVQPATGGAAGRWFTMQQAQAAAISSATRKALLTGYPG